MMIRSLSIFLIGVTSCIYCQKQEFIGSTPPSGEIRIFLGINPQDSIDFIRWNLVFSNNQFVMHANYGISKPNTNGLINGGKSIGLSGTLTKEQNIYSLQSSTQKSINLIEINSSLIHFVNEKNELLVGNGGWSFTLNSIAETISASVNIISTSINNKDSISYHGRTPCGIPGITINKDCYKLKWLVTFYPDHKMANTGRYKILGTAWRNLKSKTGKYRITKSQTGNLNYQLSDDSGNIIINLLELNKNILVFTDASGKLLIGDDDFSYTLNRYRKNNF